MNMPNNVLHNSMQQTQQQQQAQLNPYNYQQQYHRHHHHHHQHTHNSHHSSPTPQILNVSSYSNHRLDNNSIQNYQSTQLMTPLLSINQSSAYFLDRIDLENYTVQTLKQTVENILSKTKSKGLKVKIALPDDGLIIHNIPDPNQSWIFKTSELLYFWRDPYYLNIIIVVTINRSRRHSNRPYSASVFRLRGTDSAELFLQQARKFFSNLSTSNNNLNGSKFNRNKSVDSLSRTQNRITIYDPSSNNKTKPKSLLSINERSSPSTSKTISDPRQSPKRTPPPPLQPTTAIRRVTRAEFDPGKNIIQSIENTSNHRTSSETTSSTDSHTINSTRERVSNKKKLNDDEDDKITTVSNHFSNDQVAELVRELKELRNEIASLKLANNHSLIIHSEYSKQKNDSSIRTSSPSNHDITSQSEVDAETQTDFSLISHRRRQTSKKNKKTMIGTGGIPPLIRKKTSQSLTRNGRRTFSNSSTNTVSEQEETPSDISSQVNDSPNDTNTVRIQEPQPIILSAPPRPILIRNQTNSTSYTMSHGNQMISNTNSIEEGSLSSVISATIEKEMPKFLSTNNSSSNSEIIGPSVSKFTAEALNFRSSLDNSNNSTEHIYENLPILIQPNSNREAYYNIPIINVDDQQQQNQSDNHIYYTTNNNTNHESDIPGQTLSNSPPITDNNSSDLQSSIGNIQQQKPQIISAGRHRNQPIYFANHLTNPIFNVDKQLLINTIANQFGIDLNSPQLQQLIINQHLFVARKRTFANMVWQLTPDEETALCSSPTSTRTNYIDIDTIDSNNSTARSILKATKNFHSTPKRRGISWDSALE